MLIKSRGKPADLPFYKGCDFYRQLKTKGSDQFCYIPILFISQMSVSGSM